MSDMKPRLWKLAEDNTLREVATVLYHLVPRIPQQPEFMLHSAIFGERPPDYRLALVEVFMVLERPEGEWEDYRERCIAWVSDLLQDAATCEGDMLREPLDCLLGTLPDRLKAVLLCRFGFDGRGPKTLQEVGREFGLTRERVRQLEAKALRMLRHPSRSNQLRHFSPGERLRTRVLGELESRTDTPAVFLMWREEREALLSLRKLHEQVMKREHEEGDARRRELECRLDYLGSLVRDVYQMPITAAGLSGRTVSALLRGQRWCAGVPTVGEAAVLSDDELLSLRSFGKKALSEVREAVHRIAGGEGGA